MRKILAIALLEIRKAFRSRVFLILLGFLLLTLFGLPLTVKGDGTTGGLVQIMLHYTLGLTGLLLSLATLWVGCAAVAMEIEERQIQLVVTKPVSGMQIWLGKWLGLLGMNALLLSIAGGTTYVLLMTHLRADRLSPDARVELRRDILTAREQVLPDRPDLSVEVDREMQRLEERGERPAGLSDAQARDAVERSILIRMNTVAPGAAMEKTIRLSRPAPAGQDVLIRYRFSASQIGPVEIKGEWQARVPGREDAVSLVRGATAGTAHLLALPADVCAGAVELRIRYTNLDTDGITVLFDPADGIALLPYHGPFIANYLRALAILFVHLALLAALGVTAGCLFSMPVASFLSLFVLLLLGLNRIVQAAATEHALLAPVKDGAQAPGVSLILIRALYKALYGLLHPLHTPNPLELVSTGLYVSWSLLGYVVAVKGLLYGGMLLLIGVWVFNRREMALPS